MTTAPLLLITRDPSHPLAMMAFRFAKAYLESHTNQKNDNKESSNQKNGNQKTSNENDAKLAVFFYGDAAQTANRLRWQSAEITDMTKLWQSLVEKYNLALPVCVSTALSRGISDADNSRRHELSGDNLAEGFSLVGLGELATLMSTRRLLQF